MHEKYHWLNWRPLQLRILGPGYSGYRAIADTGNRAGVLNLRTPSWSMNVPLSRFYFFGQHFCTIAPCIVHYYTLYWYKHIMSPVSTISVSVSTKQLMSELGCECDRSRSRTGRCYLLSCYLEWSRCVQIMSIQQQDTIHQPPATIHHPARQTGSDLFATASNVTGM